MKYATQSLKEKDAESVATSRVEVILTFQNSKCELAKGITHESKLFQ